MSGMSGPTFQPPAFRPPSFRSPNSPPPRTVSSIPESGPLGPLTGSLGNALNASWPSSNPGTTPETLDKSAQHEAGPDNHSFAPPEADELDGEDQ